MSKKDYQNTLKEIKTSEHLVYGELDKVLLHKELNPQSESMFITGESKNQNLNSITIASNTDPKARFERVITEKKERERKRKLLLSEERKKLDAHAEEVKI
jgi:acylphosphatase